MNDPSSPAPRRPYVRIAEDFPDIKSRLDKICKPWYPVEKVEPTPDKVTPTTPTTQTYPTYSWSVPVGGNNGHVVICPSCDGAGWVLSAYQPTNAPNFDECPVCGNPNNKPCP